ncbi:MAG: metallophosphoesterase [Treponema sp.]|nr:metallophosphoesterase [Treponema sp.]
MWLFRSGFVLLAYAFMGTYTGLRTLSLLRYFLPLTRALVFWLPYLILSFSYVLVFLLRLDRIQKLRQGVMYSLPGMVYYCGALLFFEFLGLALHFTGYSVLGPLFQPLTTALSLLITLLLLIYGTLHARKIRIVPYDIKIPKGEGRLRIALLSDIHIGANVDRRWVASIIDRVMETESDLIAIAGDVFDNRLGAIRDVQGVKDELRRLKAPLGVYACLGNHDVDWTALREGATIEPVVAFLEEAGIAVLRDETRLIDGFYLTGRLDPRPIGKRSTRLSPAELTKDLDPQRPIIFVSHQPVDFFREEAAGVDLVLSGHTHGGQFFPGNLATKRIFKKAGSTHYGHWRGQKAQALITSGAATWGPVLRVGTSSEVAVIDLTFGE